MRRTLALLATAIALAALGWFGIPRARRTFIRAVVTYDAAPAAPIALAVGVGPGLGKVARTRVILVDGLSAEAAAHLPGWTALCDRGTRLTVDTGFPTVSLPVEVALWTGLTQQQTGIVFRADRPLVPPLPGIPQQIPGSIAIAESHGYIVRSLGFAQALPAAAPADVAKDADPATWDGIWRALAHQSVESTAPLVFVHVLRVDVAGHQHGGASAAYTAAATEAGAIVDELVGAAPDARWFALSDHGHLATGGHGGEERAVRHVTGCIAGPGVARATGALVHVVDVARAIADSTGATLAPGSIARPLAVALAAPLGDDQAVPPLDAGAAAIGGAIILAGLLVTAFAVRRAASLAPLWYPVALALLLVVRGEPTLSMPMVYQGSAETMTLAWLPALAVLAVATWLGLRGDRSIARVLIAQLALPIAVAAAAIAACGGWVAIAGGEAAPIVPRITAWCSPLVAVVGQASLAVALAALATAALRAFDRRAPPVTPRTAP